jgi:hypothetical protein
MRQRREKTVFKKKMKWCKKCNRKTTHDIVLMRYSEYCKEIWMCEECGAVKVIREDAL